MPSSVVTVFNFLYGLLLNKTYVTDADAKTEDWKFQLCETEINGLICYDMHRTASFLLIRGSH